MARKPDHHIVLILYSTIGEPMEEQRFQALQQPLPADIRQKVARYRRWQDAQACLLGRLLLIEGLNRLGLDGAALIHRLQYTGYGRPYLDMPVDFNISHSGDYVLCALSRHYRLGTDVEQVRSVALADFREQMAEAEWAGVSSAADPIRAFFYYWTRKEAAIKAHGHGLSLPLKEVLIGEGEVIMEGRAWPLFELRLSPGYVCHLVTDERVPPEDIRVEEVVF